MRFMSPLLALLVTVSFIVLVPGDAASQDGHGEEAGMTVVTRTQLTSMGALEGDGTLRLTFAGETARTLRENIHSRFDANIDMILQAEEVRSLLVALSSALDGRPYWGVVMNVSSEFETMDVGTLSKATEGLVNYEVASSADFSVSMDFSARGQSFTKNIFITQLAVETFRGAILTATGYAFEGTMRLDHRTVMFGIGSFTSPEAVNGTFQELRTPAGAVMWYETYLDVSSDGNVSQESVLYERFSLMENPQIAFAILFIGTFMLARMPKRRFEKFRKLHPKRYRKYARPKNSVRAFVLAVIVAMWALYAFPFLLSPVLDGFLLYSYYFMFITPLGVVAGYVFSRRVYDRSALDIPEETVIEVRQALLEPEAPETVGTCALCSRPIEAEEEMHVCDSCGTEMHLACADRAQACPSCSAILFPQDTRSIECKVCGESFLHSGEEDPYSIQCTRCGAFQEEVEAGKNYLIVDRDATMAYRMIRAMGLSGRPAMVITSEFPGKIREEFGLGEEADVRWLSDSTTDIDNVNPKDLEGDAMETVSTFLMTTKRAGLLLDGFDLLMELNGYDKALAFIRRLNDLAMIHGSTILMSLDREGLEDDEFARVNDEFDEIHDYS